MHTHLSDGDVAIPRPSGLPPAKPKAEIELGEENEVRPNALDQLERFAAACGTEHVEAVVAELAAQVLADLGLGLGDEDGTRHAADASRGSRVAPDVLSGESVPSVPQPAARDAADLTALAPACTVARSSGQSLP